MHADSKIRFLLYKNVFYVHFKKKYLQLKLIYWQFIYKIHDILSN